MYAQGLKNVEANPQAATLSGSAASALRYHYESISNTIGRRDRLTFITEVACDLVLSNSFLKSNLSSLHSQGKAGRNETCVPTNYFDWNVVHVHH